MRLCSAFLRPGVSPDAEEEEEDDEEEEKCGAHEAKSRLNRLSPSPHTQLSGLLPVQLTNMEKALHHRTKKSFFNSFFNLPFNLSKQSPPPLDKF
jgi:hypothetical protein